MSLIDKAFGITKSEPFKTQYLTPSRMKKLYFVLYQLYPYAFNKYLIFLHHAHKYFGIIISLDAKEQINTLNWEPKN